MSTSHALPPIALTAYLISQDKQAYFEFTGPRGSFLMSRINAHRPTPDIWARLSAATGVEAVTSPQRNAILKQLENLPEACPSVIASGPGWTGNHFVTGDGRVLPSTGAPIDRIAFDPVEKFRPLGTLVDWQQEVGPYVTGHDLPNFAIGLALTGPLLPFLPHDNTNPQAEFVGQPRAGKTILGAVAASVWSGCADRPGGGGSSWRMTPAAFDLIRLEHRGTIIVLDEAEDTPKRMREEMTKAVAYSGAGADLTRRLTDVERPPVAPRHAVLSTSNTPIVKVLARENADSREGAMSRMPTLYVDREPSDGRLSIFNSNRLPENVEAAASGLRAACGRAYGTAGPAFAEKLAEQLQDGATAAALRNRVNELFQRALVRLEKLDPASDARHRQMLAAVHTSLTLAIGFGIIPKDWCAPNSVILRIFATLATEEGRDAIQFLFADDRVKRAVKAKKKTGHIVDMRAGFDGKLSAKIKGAIFVKDGRVFLAIDKDYLAKILPNSDTYLSQMKKRDRLLLPRSEGDRLAVKPPKASGLDAQKRYIVMRFNALG